MSNTPSHFAIHATETVDPLCPNQRTQHARENIVHTKKKRFSKTVLAECVYAGVKILFLNVRKCAQSCNKVAIDFCKITIITFFNH